MSNWRYAFLGICLLLCSSQILAVPVIVVQDTLAPSKEVRYDQETITHSPLDENQLQEYQQNEDFNYVEALPEDNWWTRFKQWLQDIWRSFIRWIFGSEPATGFWRLVVEILPYLLGLGLFILLVWIFLKLDSGSLLFEKKQPPQVALAADEELLKHDDIQSLIDKALKAGNYRLAIRFYYLLVLQKLSGAQLIAWQVQKTNHDYIFEIEDPKLRQQFRSVTDIYDYIWYGNFDVDASAFAKAEKSFLTLNAHL